VIQVEQLGFRFGAKRRWIFQELSFALGRGQALAVLGPNGQGKTTLLKCLAGLLRPSRGALHVAAEDSYLPQAFGTPLAYSVLDVVLMGRARHVGVFGSPTASDRRLADEALAELGLGAFAQRPVTTLSGGERQMVLIARALASGAQIMLLDEPTASLDFRNQALVLATLRRLAAERDLTVVFTSHDPAHAVQVADRALLMLGPGEFDEGPAAAVLTEARLSGLYGVPIRGATALVDGRRCARCSRTCACSQVPALEDRERA
jgi:iron complex transport system ATP-binding protein